MNTITLIGIAASFCTALSMLPQLIKLIREKKAEDISLAMLYVLCIGLVLWVIYGIGRKDAILIAANSFSLMVNTLTIVFVLKYR